MAMSILEQTVPPGEDSYYTTEWYTVVESHLQWLVQHPETAVVSIDRHDAYKYEGDLAGLLLNMDISVNMHHVVMRMNNMVSPTDFDTEMLYLAIPSASVINEMMNFHQTITKKFA